MRWQRLLLAVGLAFAEPAWALPPVGLEHVVTQLQLLIFSALAFTVLMRTGIYPPELRSTNLDFDWVYRVLGYNLGTTLMLLAREAWESISGGIADVSAWWSPGGDNLVWPARYWKPLGTHLVGNTIRTEIPDQLASNSALLFFNLRDKKSRLVSSVPVKIS